MKRSLCLFLALFLLLSGCGQAAPEDTIPATRETEPIDTFPYPEIREKLTWEAINALPVKRADMTVTEMREACVEFMRFSKTALWTPNDNMHFVRNSQGTEDDLYKGVVYGGLPYVGLGTGNVYRMMDYIDEATGVMDMEMPMQNPKLFGNQCSCTTFWAWGRVINSMGDAYTANMTQFNGYLRVGPYTYPDSTIRFSKQDTTTLICQKNGLEVMCRSYAQLRPADGLVYYTTAGHAIMVSSEPHVEYKGDQINAAASYITILEQGQSWEEYQNAAGDTAQVKNSVDKKVTFLQLFNASYIPFTYAEFLGTKGIDETECDISITGDTVAADKLFYAKVTANFGISDVYVSLTDDGGREVYRLAVRAGSPNCRALAISPSGTNAFHWGEYEKLSGSYKATVSVQLSTGERPTVFEGTVQFD